MQGVAGRRAPIIACTAIQRGYMLLPPSQLFPVTSCGVVQLLQELHHRRMIFDQCTAGFESSLTYSSSRTEAINAAMSSLSVDAQKRAEKDSAKKEAKAAAAEARAKEAKDQAMVYIKRVERNKRKFVTEVSGLEAHGLDLKKVAKEWGKKCRVSFHPDFYVEIVTRRSGVGIQEN